MCYTYWCQIVLLGPIIYSNWYMHVLVHMNISIRLYLELISINWIIHTLKKHLGGEIGVGFESKTSGWLLWRSEFWIHAGIEPQTFKSAMDRFLQKVDSVRCGYFTSLCILPRFGGSQKLFSINVGFICGFWW